MKYLRCVVVFCLFPLFSLDADIAEFNEKVKEAEESPKTEREERANTENMEENPFADAIFALFRIIWAANNLNTRYGEYPYEPSGYIRWRDENGEPRAGDRLGWFGADIQSFTLDGYGHGIWARLEGHFLPFFGPYLETWHLTDGGAFQNAFRLGGLIPLFQSAPFSMSVYGQWNYWYGSLERNGGALGLEIRSYPVKPLAFSWRGGFQAFENFQIGESELKIGIVLGRWEPFIGWRSWALQTGGENPTVVAFKQGYFAGLRAYF
jgi:hypothetical protein